MELDARGLVASWVLSLCALGCSPDGAGEGTGGSGGTGGGALDGPASLTVRPMLYSAPTDAPILLDEDPDAQLVAAPQGGHVLMVGARVFGLDGDTIEVTATLRRANGKIAQFSSRTVVTQPVDGEPGWREDDRRTTSQFAHVALCPDYVDYDIVDQSFSLEVHVLELYADDSEGTGVTEITPRCDAAVNSPLCRCECTANYVLGRCAHVTGDAGVDGLDGGADAG